MSDLNRFSPGAEQFASNELIEKVRNHLKEALDKCNLPFEHTKDRLLSAFTYEVCLALL